VLGGWVPSTPEPEVKLLFRAHSFQHAWHAELWGGLLPVSGAGEVALGRSVGGVLDALVAATGSVERLAGAYRAVLPRLVTTYRACRQRACEPSDAPLGRVLTLVLADDEGAWRAGEALLQSLVAGATEAERAAATVGAIEAKFATEGGLDVIERV
jgi:hypothetical protein